MALYILYPMYVFHFCYSCVCLILEIYLPYEMLMELWFF